VFENLETMFAMPELPGAVVVHGGGYAARRRELSRTIRVVESSSGRAGGHRTIATTNDHLVKGKASHRMSVLRPSLSSLPDATAV